MGVFYKFKAWDGSQRTGRKASCCESNFSKAFFSTNIMVEEHIAGAARSLRLPKILVLHESSTLKNLY